jgi:carnitine 3-dehydrogenase
LILRTIGLLGGGVIGGGWAARFLLNGYDVVLHDPDPEAPRRVEEQIENARRALAALTLAPLPTEGRLSFTADLEEAAAGADFIQESAPERLDLKQRLLAAASRTARADVVIASSTSGLRPSLLQREMERPERLTVAHPFNPVYLLPLVELCGGEQTTPETLTRAAELYRAIGMRPLVLEREVDGFIADRLLEALWREALWLVNDGVATVEQIDDAIRFGPGLRWSIMGTFLLYRIAGGEEGVRHFMDQFGPALNWPWTKLTDVPELNDELLATLERQSDEQASGRSIRELERLRDNCLVGVLQALREQNVGAGSTLRQYEHALLGRRAAAVDGTPVVYRTQISPAWIDYNGHTTESAYLRLASDATDTLLASIGVDGDYVASGRSYYTVETHIRHLHESRAGDQVIVTTQLLGADDKRLHLFHQVVRGDDVIATAEQMLLHVDTSAGRSSPAPPDVLARVRAIADAHATMPAPEGAGRRIDMAPATTG